MSQIQPFNRKALTFLPQLILMLLGLVEAVVGLLQLFGIASRGNSPYLFTGDFYNPGPYACYLAVIFPIALRWMSYDGHWLKKLTGASMAMIIAMLVLVSLSRTAIIACLVGGTVALCDKSPAQLSTRRWKIVTFGLVATVLIASGYMVKKDSANGRFLMWRVACEAAASAPSTGVGWDQVAGAYGDAQEAYFESGRGSAYEIMVADAPEYVFNEYLQVAIAFGIWAAIGMTIAIAIGLISSYRSKSLAICGSVAAIAIVMFASYPLQFPLFVYTIILTLIAAYLSALSMIRARICACATMAAGTLWFMSHNDIEDVNATFLVGHSLHNLRAYQESNNALIPLVAHSSDPMPLNIIGKNYQQLGMPDSADYWFRRAANRCPNRHYPHYLLMLLYADSASRNTELMRQEAELLLTKPIKISSPAIYEMRAKARELLETISNE